MQLDGGLALGWHQASASFSWLSQRGYRRVSEDSQRWEPGVWGQERGGRYGTTTYDYVYCMYALCEQRTANSWYIARRKAIAGVCGEAMTKGIAL